MRFVNAAVTYAIGGAVVYAIGRWLGWDVVALLVVGGVAVVLVDMSRCPRVMRPW